MNINYLNDLNQSQLQAVKNINGPVLVIAGAGSGKTRVLTYKIAYLIQNGISPAEILALTFTNKAAGEMKERIANIVSFQTARYLWMGTFHSIFARILRVECELLGYQPSFTIYDTTDSKSVIRNIVKELQLDDKIYKTSLILSRISAAKNNLITAGMYVGDTAAQEIDKSNRIPLFSNIYTLYSERCFRANAMDFDDLLLNTNILFRDHPDVLERYQNRFRYILVDEYQDTNYSQYLIVNKLAANNHNICVVGDDAQSIYSFRGARIENILSFQRDYPEHQIFKLEQNYRSTQTIVNAANGIIDKNIYQIKKNVFSKNEEGEKITIYQAITDIEEGLIVTSDIFDKRNSNQLNWKDFSILYRTNAQSRILEEALRKKNVPYKVYGGQSFYERKEIKDILAYCRLVINNNDEEALRRVINYPKRGIGDTTIDKLFEIAKQTNCNVIDVITNAHNYPTQFNKGTINKLILFSEIIKELSANIEETDAWTKTNEIVNRSGISADIKQSQTPEDISRLENIEELLNGVKAFTEEAQTNGDPYMLTNYLEGVSLLTDQDNEKEEDHNKVTLMTIHSAKGLEFKMVYIVGMEDTLFPSQLSVDNPRELEEERRLFYVAITRAEKQVTLSYALNRYKWGNLEMCSPSRFLRELDPRYIYYPQTENIQKVESKKQSFTSLEPKTQQKSFFTPQKPSTPNISEPSINVSRKPSLKKINLATSSGISMSSTSIHVGDKVEHERFGKGMVISIDGEPPNDKAIVDFGPEGQKKLLLRFARLTVIS